MRTILKNFLLSSFLLLTVCCHAQQPILDSFVNTLELNSIYAKQVSWRKLKKELKNKKRIDTPVTSIQFIEDVQEIYSKLNDRHGSFFYQGKTYKGHFTKRFSSADSLLLNYVMDERYALQTTILEDRYAYICIPSPSIPSTLFGNEVEAKKAISSMAKQLQTLYLSVLNKPIDGVIIDFRLSLGGAYPIIATSLAPVLGNGELFSMEGRDKKDLIAVKLMDGNLYENEKLIAQTDYQGARINTKVAILLGGLTSSAAEQTALAFKGRNNVKFIGENTAGFLSMTSLQTLPDGNYFTYSSKILRAYDHKLYPDFLQPDVEVKSGDNFENLKADRKVMEALKWFKSTN